MKTKELLRLEREISEVLLSMYPLFSEITKRNQVSRQTCYHINIANFKKLHFNFKINIFIFFLCFVSSKYIEMKNVP